MVIETLSLSYKNRSKNIGYFSNSLEFNDYFKDELTCYKFLESKRWPEGPVCPHCGSTKKPNVVATRGALKDMPSYRCTETLCTLPFTVRTNTIFQGSKLPLRLWFHVIYSWCSNNKNISSAQLSRHMGVTQKTMWGATMRIRTLMSDIPMGKLSGVVEVDECYISKGNFSSWYRRADQNENIKTPIVGMKQRGGEVRIFSVANKRKYTLEPLILENVEIGSTIYTDSCISYTGLNKWYTHATVNHRKQQFVRKDNVDAHTQNIENVWGRLKRSIRGAHHSVSQEHLQSYCDEIAFRINYSHFSKEEMFHEILNRSLSRVLKIERNIRKCTGRRLKTKE